MNLPRIARAWLHRRLVPVIAALVAFYATAPRAYAGLSGRVLIVTSNQTSPLLDEGLVRVRGELAAMGLTTEIRVDGSEPRAEPQASSDFRGVLVFERFGDWLRIQAWNAATPLPVTQWIDASDPAVDAEVVAVRAVEALRAALLPYPRPRSEESPPEPEQPRPSKVSPIAEIHLPKDTPEPRPAIQEARTTATVWLGPALGFDVGPGAVHYGAQLGFAYGARWLAGGARFEVTRAKIPVRAEAGEVQVTRLNVLLDARTRFPVLKHLDGYAALGGGIAQHRVEGIAAPGYSGESKNHMSMVFLGEVGALYSFTSRLGGYFSAHGTIDTDAPVVRVDHRPVATLDRPQIGISGGVTLELD